MVFMPPPTIVGGDHHVSGRSSVRCPLTPILRYAISRSVRGGGTSMKLAANNHRVSENCWKGFQGQRSNVKVTARPHVLLRQLAHTTVRPLCVRRRH